MATLSRNLIKRYWKSPKNAIQIQKAGQDNQRQLFHAMLTLRDGDTNSYQVEFLKKVEKILANDAKFEKFKSFMTYPLVSNALISKASDEWNKVFYAQDKTKEYNFTDDKLADALEAYLVKIDFQNTLGQDLFTLVKQQVNTIAVIDAPVIETGDRLVSNTTSTAPYIYFLNTGDVHDVGVNVDGSIQYVMFIRKSVEIVEGQKDKEIRELVVIDDDYYRVFLIPETNNNNSELTPVLESPHNLGYCPATFIWQDFVDQKNKVIRFNSVLEIVEKLDRYIMLTIFREHADLYASFPIMWRYVDACEDGSDLEQLKTGLLGPGTAVEISVPEGDGSRMSVPVGFVENNPALLKYIEEKLRKLEVEITKHLTGVDNEIQNEKAFNESQIRSQYETRHSVLRYWAENFQAVEKFLVDTIARLIFGDVSDGGKFIDSTIDYGMDYFLYDTVTATNEYRDGKEAGLPPPMLDLILNKVEQSLTRNNPVAATKAKILMLLVPYIHETLDRINPASDDYELKANFTHYINKFELENGSIIKFGSLVDLNTKIQAISSKLYDYVKEHRKTNPYLGELLPGQQQAIGDGSVSNTAAGGSVSS